MRMYQGFENKEDAKEFYKKHDSFALSYEKSDIEKKASCPIWIRECRQYFGLDEKYKYVVMYNV